MKNNYDKYADVDAEFYKAETIVRRFIGKECDSAAFNSVLHIRNKKVLELGCGAGRHTEYYYKYNAVKCVDVNDHVFNLKDVAIIKGNATDIDSLFPETEKFDFILSFWMTEFLTELENIQLLVKAKNKLNKDGKIIFSFVSKGLWGNLYVTGSQIKGINKYNYSLKKLVKMSSGAGLKIEKILPVKKLGFELGKIVTLSSI